MPEGKPPPDKEHPQQGPTVDIEVNGVTVRIHRGHQTVAAIKQAAGVPLTDDLDEIKDGRLVPLPDDGAVTIKGGEKFVSHKKSGQSS